VDICQLYIWQTEVAMHVVGRKCDVVLSDSVLFNRNMYIHQFKV